MIDVRTSPQAAGRVCSLCDGSEFRQMHDWPVGHPRNPATIPLAYWQCRCSMAFLHPIPRADQLAGGGNWWDPQYVRHLKVRRRWWKRIRERAATALCGSAATRLVRTTRRLAPGGRLLDIGCGTGELMAYARRWFDCEGLDVSADAVEAARAQGFSVLHGTLESVELAAGAYDVITMNAVLEHLEDPVGALRQLHGAARVGGVVAIRVPKLGGPSHRWHGREWNGFRVGHHLSMFTGESLRLSLAAAGFAPLRSPCRDRPLDDILIVWARKVREIAEWNLPIATGETVTRRVA